MASENGVEPSTFKISNPFRTRILAGEICPVMSVKLVANNEIAMACKLAGIYGMFIDMEHSTLDLRDVSPIVRVPSKSHWHISKAFDAGGAGVVVPHIESVEEVRGLAHAGKFAPLGVRGCINAQPIFNFQTVPTKIQNEVLNHETMLIPMIETPSTVELVDEILAIDDQ
ncbi:hypothetical protein IL306_009308 [Fusarium sp. DS 682]|nr:hypothetical protein IL306_009308 [Fusarium sp. DS 682]